MTEENKPKGEIEKEAEFDKGKVVEEKSAAPAQTVPERSTQTMTERREQRTSEEMITISRKSIEELKAGLEELKEQNKILFEIADKRQLYRIRERLEKDQPKEVAVREFNGKIVVGWEMVEDVVQKSPQTGVWMEKQVVKVIYEDGTSDVVNLRDFELGFKKIMCKRTGVINDELTGGKIFKLVRMDGGGEIEIADTFVN